MSSLLYTFGAEVQERIEHVVLDLQKQMAALAAAQSGEEMIDIVEAGRIVVSQKVTRSNSWDNDIPEQNVAVYMTEGAILLKVNDSIKADARVSLSPEQAIEIAQLLLKTAEVQPEYAERAKALREELANLGTKYKDQVSGLGLESEVDVLDERGTFVVSSTAIEA